MLHHNTAYQRVAVKNYSDRNVRFELSFRFASDFADIFEVRARPGRAGGSRARPSIGADAVLLNHEGLDGVLRQTKVVFDPAPNTLEHHTPYRSAFAPNQVAVIFLALVCGPAETWKAKPSSRACWRRGERRAPRTRNAATVQTSNAIFNEMLCRSMADLDMLMTETPAWPLSVRRHPLVFDDVRARRPDHRARDAVDQPGDRAGCAEAPRPLSGDNHDHDADAEPGKILHEMRGGEMAALREVPFGRYYGSVDSTPLFVMLAGLYSERTGDCARCANCGRLWKRRWPGWTAQATQTATALSSISAANETGLVNQGWKDSYDSVFHADGRLAEGPIALVRGPRLRLRGQAACGSLRARWRPTSTPRRSIRKRRACESVSMRRSGATTSASMRWRSTAQKAMPRPHFECGPAAVHRNRQSRTRAIIADGLLRTGVLFRLGYSHRRDAARRATIRCPITTARSGRTTML